MPRQKKLLLRKYKYPPEEAEDVLQTVIRQCELWVDETPMDVGA